MVRADAVDRDDVEAAADVQASSPRQIVQRHRRNAPLLPLRQSFNSSAVAIGPARLHLHKDNDVVVSADDVNFSKPGSITARKNCVPAPLEFTACSIFSQQSELLTRWDDGHVTHNEQAACHKSGEIGGVG